MALWDVYCDRNDQFHSVSADGSFVNVNGYVHSVETPGDYAIYPRVIGLDGITLTAYRRHSPGDLIVVRNTDGKSWNLGQSHGNQNFIWRLNAVNGAWELAVAQPHTWDRHSFSSTTGDYLQVETAAGGNPLGYSQGFSDWYDEEDSPIWLVDGTDAWMTTLVNGEVVYWPMTRNSNYADITVGLGNVGQPQVVAYDLLDNAMYTVWLGNSPYPPRVAVSSQGEIRVAVSGASKLLSREDFVAYQDLPPPDSVPLLGRPFGVIAYCFYGSSAKGYANAMIPAHPPEGHVPDLPVWGEAQYTDAFGAPLPSGWVSEPFYRDKNETLDHYVNRCVTEWQLYGPRLWPAVGCFLRNHDLKPREVVEAFVAMANAAHVLNWDGMELFAFGRVYEDGTPDMPPELLPYLARFMSGITGLPEKNLYKPVPPVITPPIVVPPAIPPVVAPPIKEKKPMLSPDAREAYIDRRGIAINEEFPLLSAPDARQRAHEIDAIIQGAKRNATPTECQEGARLYLIARNAYSTANGNTEDPNYVRAITMYNDFLSDTVLT